MSLFDLIKLKRLVNRPTAIREHEGQIRYNRDGDVDGKFYGARYIAGGTYEWGELLALMAGGTPTVAALPAAGDAATISVSGTDQSGTITLTPDGAGIATGNIIDLTFAVARPNTSYRVLIAPGSSAARTLGGVVGRSARTGAKVTLATATALTGTQQYQWDYWIL